MLVSVVSIRVKGGRVTTMTTEEFDSLKSVLDLDPMAHRHHDVLAAVLDMFSKLHEDQDDRWLLAHCVASQLLLCRCVEGRILRREVRRLCGVPGESIPVEICGGRTTCEVTGRSYYWTNMRGEEIRYPAAYRRAYGRPIYHSSTRSCVVSVDVVLVLAGLRSLLPAVLHAVPEIG